MSLSLAQALRVHGLSSVAFIGAGGKTTAMLQLARQVAPPVILTATSHLGAWQAELADQHIIAESPESIDGLEDRLSGIVLVTGAIESQRTRPVSDSVLNRLREFCQDRSFPLLIESDGSRQKPLKAWAAHEPPVPGFVDLVVQVMGLRSLGKPLSDEYVHRADIFAELSGLEPGSPITADALRRVLLYPQGGRKNMPAHARPAVLLNQADTPQLQSAAKGLAQSLIPTYHSAVISSLEHEGVFAAYEPVAGIILAAGASTRFGQPKQLLDWRGEPFVRAVANTALQAGLSPVVVVTGANGESVEAAVNDLPVTVLRNEQWHTGQASSIRAAVEHLSSRQEVGAAIFLLSDQPQLTTSILRALIEKHAEGLYPIIAPMVIDRRANPVLFDRVTFPELLTLEGDVGGRAIFHKHRVEYVPWHDDRLLLDVDTPEMYQRLISDETL